MVECHSKNKKMQLYHNINSHPTGLAIAYKAEESQFSPRIKGRRAISQKTSKLQGRREDA